MRENYIQNVEHSNDRIVVNSLDHSKCASDFLRALKDCLSRGWKSIEVEIKATRVFPNACLPICGIIQYYHSQGIAFNFNIPKKHYLLTCGFIAPFYKEAEEIEKELFPFDKIFAFDSISQIGNLTQAYINSISHQIECNEGVITGLSWCINEVMDNVLTHSGNKLGFVLAQLHPQTGHIVFCIYDYGMGIYNSLKQSKHSPKTELDSISLAIQEGVGDGKGQGNGLFGLYQVVHQNSGRLTLTSGASAIMIKNTGEIEKFDHIPFLSYPCKGTIVDFQLDLQKSIDIEDVFKSIGGYDGFDFRIDNMLSNEDEYIHYDIYKDGQGTATREAGAYLRHDIINILRRENRCIILDFTNVQTISSSFVDELIAKLVLSLGFINFNANIRIIGMNKTVKFLCERSLYMRVHDEWENHRG